MKLCKDCKWLCLNSNRRFCNYHESGPSKPDYVNGGMISMYPLQNMAQAKFAQEERERSSGCGPDAKYFEPKT